MYAAVWRTYPKWLPSHHFSLHVKLLRGVLYVEMQAKAAFFSVLLFCFECENDCLVSNLIKTDLRCTLRVTVVLLPVGTARLVAMQL